MCMNDEIEVGEDDDQFNEELLDSSQTTSLFKQFQPPPPEDPTKLLNDTLEMLSVTAIHISDCTALQIFKNVHSLGSKKFTFKTKLGTRESMETLLALLANNNTKETLVIHGCKALSQMTINDTDNKCLLGSIGACRDVVNAIKLHMGNHAVLVPCFKLMINLCNATFQHRLSIAEVAARKDSNPMDISTCNNRLNFNRAGICVIIYDILQPILDNSSTSTVSMTGNHHHQHQEIILTLCSAIAILAENDVVSRALGEARICEQITDLMKLTEYLNIITAASWSLVILCSDNKVGNKQLFNAAGIIDVLMDNLDHYQQKTPHYARIPEFHTLMERQCWCLAILTTSCPRNIQGLKNRPQCKETLEGIIGSHLLKDGAKDRAKMVFKRVFQQ